MWGRHCCPPTPELSHTSAESTPRGLLESSAHRCLNCKQNVFRYLSSPHCLNEPKSWYHAPWGSVWGLPRPGRLFCFARDSSFAR